MLYKSYSINTIINYHACKCSVAHYSSRGISDSGDWQWGMSWAGLKQLTADGDRSWPTGTDRPAFPLTCLPGPLVHSTGATNVFTASKIHLHTWDPTHLGLSNCLRPFCFLFTSCVIPDSKHWFTTPFLQPLLYLVTP